MTVARHLFVVGFMGAGKSTVGELVAGRLNRSFVDLDALIESDARMPVAEIFAAQGEEGFRELESSALLSLESLDPAVVACGGGVVLSAENRVVLKRLGTVVYLKVTAGEAVARIDDASTRPLLAGSGGSLAATTLLAARESLYTSVADLVVDTMGQTPSQVAEDVVAAYESGGM